jgi:hypothetical protein
MAETGMALAIFAAMAAIVTIGLAVGYVLSRGVTRGRSWSGPCRAVAVVAFGALGVAGGVLVVIATFFETTWAPPPRVQFNTPPGFTHTWVFLLEDPSSANRLMWQGIEAPFFGKRTTIDVPMTGIMRVKSLNGISGRVDIDARWNDGSYSTGQGGGPGPKATGATTVSSFNWVNGKDKDDPPSMDRDVLGAYIMAREQAAK